VETEIPMLEQVRSEEEEVLKIHFLSSNLIPGKAIQTGDVTMTFSSN